MEQRSAVRKSAGLGAVVSCPQFGLFRGEIDNLSMQGMYVRTRNVRLCLNVPVTVTFQPEPGQPLLHCNAEGIVVHEDLEGFGIRFAELESSCISNLRKLMDRLPDVDEGLDYPELLAV